MHTQGSRHADRAGVDLRVLDGMAQVLNAVAKLLIFGTEGCRLVTRGSVTRCRLHLLHGPTLQRIQFLLTIWRSWLQWLLNKFQTLFTL